jgi:excisionase family DNA binding protein
MQSTIEEANRNGDSENQLGAHDLKQGGWLTTREAAAHASLGVSTIRQACKRRELRHIRVRSCATGPIRTRTEWVDEWLERWAHGGPLV